jgi:hypothetical protein
LQLWDDDGDNCVRLSEVLSVFEVVLSLYGRDDSEQQASHLASMLFEKYAGDKELAGQFCMPIRTVLSECVDKPFLNHLFAIEESPMKTPKSDNNNCSNITVVTPAAPLPTSSPVLSPRSIRAIDIVEEGLEEAPKRDETLTDKQQPPTSN